MNVITGFQYDRVTETIRKRNVGEYSITEAMTYIMGAQDFTVFGSPVYRWLEHCFNKLASTKPGIAIELDAPGNYGACVDRSL